MELVSIILIIVFLLVAFAAIHSLMANLSFKCFATRVFGFRAEVLYMPLFNLIALLTILPLAYLLYKNPGPFLYIIPSPWRWVMICGQFIAATFAPRAFLDAPNRFKIRSQLSAPNTPEAGSLNIRGIYRWVRDPFLLPGLIIMWLTPFMTTNLLVRYPFWPLYIWIWGLHWERGLVSQFGDEYQEYQKRVHRIIPQFWGHH